MWFQKVSLPDPHRRAFVLHPSPPLQIFQFSSVHTFLLTLLLLPPPPPPHWNFSIDLPWERYGYFLHINFYVELSDLPWNKTSFVHSLIHLFNHLVSLYIQILTTTCIEKVFFIPGKHNKDKCKHPFLQKNLTHHNPDIKENIKLLKWTEEQHLGFGMYTIGCTTN